RRCGAFREGAGRGHAREERRGGGRRRARPPRRRALRRLTVGGGSAALDVRASRPAPRTASLRRVWHPRAAGVGRAEPPRSATDRAPLQGLGRPAIAKSAAVPALCGTSSGTGFAIAPPVALRSKPYSPPHDIRS